MRDRKELKKYHKDNRESIINQYRTVWSVSEMIKNDKNLSRGIVVKILKEENIYEGVDGKNVQKMKQLKIIATNKRLYGVKNVGELKENGWTTQNNIPYDKFIFSLEFDKYRKEVERLSKNTLRRMIRKGNLPEFCFYTNIRFVDNEQENVNPNDPRKRTLDHKTPIIICFLNDWTIEQASAKSNLNFVLRYINSTKGNTLHENFLPIADIIKKRMINEGYTYKNT
tara:strand:- start:142 stop:819 length:678 start_codon:yes stop_codon:yes gene_type:complete